MFLKRPDADWEKKADTCELGSLPEGCVCKENSQVYCINANLPAVPFGIPDHATVLDLSGNQINTISHRDFETLDLLEKLMIMHSELKLILPGTFRTCTRLRELYLTGNELGDIPGDMFPEDNVLQILDLRLNRLRVLTPDYFKRLGHLQKLYLPNNMIENVMPGSFSSLTSLHFLNLDGNNLQKIDVNYFTGLPSLHTLRLSRNRIYYTEDHSFITLSSMAILDLSNNLIRKVPANTFTGLRNLTHLDLRQNEIVWIEKAAFSSLQRLVSLNVEQNNFHGVDKSTFDVMPRLRHIYFDTFYMCAYAAHVRDCHPEGDGISSRYNLLENSLLRSAVWAVAIMACLGNVLVFMGRSIVKDDNAVHSFLIKNLSLADLLMAIYLLVLATHDLRYRGSYLDRDQEWRDSWGCDVIGILATVSNEASVMTLTMITLDRYICILYPLKMRRRTVTHAYLVMSVLWAVCCFVAVVPVTGLPYFGTLFYRNNAVCIPLFLHDPLEHGWEYSAFIFLGLNLAAFLFIVYAYAAMFLAIRRSRMMYRPADESQERCLMKRFFLIVITNLVCWMPIIFLKTAALAGMKISGDLYAWLVVFVLPVNCALNPLLYTLTTRLFKQRLITGLASAVWRKKRRTSRRRRSLETNSSFSNFSFSSLKSRGSSSSASNQVNNSSVVANGHLPNQHLLHHHPHHPHHQHHQQHHHHLPLRPEKKLDPGSELESMTGLMKDKGNNLYVGKMKYMYSHGRVIYPPGRQASQYLGYKQVSSS
ncbi:uncharacterized protein LOC143283501 [Babylonia areolata]|uniref:uncharacterized protein LOC143283501 n=1 Tax=Babylonia areolata TaxID=304850 RepID=UPI003FD55EEB